MVATTQVVAKNHTKTEFIRFYRRKFDQNIIYAVNSNQRNMSSDVILYCERLKLSVGASNTKEASINLDVIDQYFNDRISDDEIGKFQNGNYFWLNLKIYEIFYSMIHTQIWRLIKY